MSANYLVYDEVYGVVGAGDDHGEQDCSGNCCSAADACVERCHDATDDLGWPESERAVGYSAVGSADSG